MGCGSSTIVEEIPGSDAESYHTFKGRTADERKRKRRQQAMKERYEALYSPESSVNKANTDDLDNTMTTTTTTATPAFENGELSLRSDDHRQDMTSGFAIPNTRESSAAAFDANACSLLSSPRHSLADEERPGLSGGGYNTSLRTQSSAHLSKVRNLRLVLEDAAAATLPRFTGGRNNSTVQQQPDSGITSPTGSFVAGYSSSFIATPPNEMADSIVSSQQDVLQDISVNSGGVSVQEVQAALMQQLHSVSSSVVVHPPSTTSSKLHPVFVEAIEIAPEDVASFHHEMMLEQMNVVVPGTNEVHHQPSTADGIAPQPPGRADPIVASLAVDSQQTTSSPLPQSPTSSATHTEEPEDEEQKRRDYVLQRLLEQNLMPQYFREWPVYSNSTTTDAHSAADSGAANSPNDNDPTENTTKTSVQVDDEDVNKENTAATINKERNGNGTPTMDDTMDHHDATYLSLFVPPPPPPPYEEHHQQQQQQQQQKLIDSILCISGKYTATPTQSPRFIQHDTDDDQDDDDGSKTKSPRELSNATTTSSAPPSLDGSLRTGTKLPQLVPIAVDGEETPHGISASGSPQSGSPAAQPSPRSPPVQQQPTSPLPSGLATAYTLPPAVAVVPVGLLKMTDIERSNSHSAQRGKRRRCAGLSSFMSEFE